jgi:glycosyltransferase involved in cell wall biosynthesis
MTPRPLRLLLSSHGASPFGAERVLLIMAEGLARRGHAVTLEIPHEGPALDAARALDGVEVWLSGRPRLPRDLGEGVAYCLGLPGAIERLRRHTRERGYDLVWVNSMFNPPAALAARFAGVPVVWHLHERNLRGPASLPMAWLVRFGADVAVPVSGFVAGTFSRIPGGAGRQEVLFEQFPRLPELPPAPDDGELVVGFVGQLEPRKRVGDLLRALAEVSRVRGLLVGDGKRRGEVLRDIERLGLEERVEWGGLQRDVVPFYARMHCVVIPSRDEPCPLVAFEAMSVGRPVIASEHGGHPEVLGDAALYFPLGDTDALAAQIERLRDDPGMRSDLRTLGLERVPRFDRESWLDQVERIVKGAVGGARARA